MDIKNTQQGKIINNITSKLISKEKEKTGKDKINELNFLNKNKGKKILH